MTSPFLFRDLLGVPPSTATPSDSTLILIDVADVDASRKVIASLLKKYRAANGNVIHVLHSTPEGAPVFTPRTKLAEEFEELTPKDGEKVIHKNFAGSFAGTDLQEHLDELGSKKIILARYMAHVCVSTTVRQAAQRGYDVVAVEDAVGDRDIPGVDAKQLVKVALSEIADAFGTIVQSSSIV
ncbi:isochorismatase [Dactylonectria macrodidyma]|uniref:Isochorismatase n=1 Tax=Dactylonectria macrodidyma TaxID=307937 RepID=A0A9P9F5G4_9HYPO|nr:isochorismatase [Dactylonectria macrodidyma]